MNPHINIGTMRTRVIAYSLSKGGSGQGIKNFTRLLENVFADIQVSTTDCETHYKKLFNTFFAKFSHFVLSLVFFSTVYRTINFYSRISFAGESEIVFLGWFGNNTLTFKHLKKMNVPIFIRLSDEWLYNGFIHYGEAETNFLAKLYRKQKIDFLNQKNVFLICPSEWIRNRLVTSTGIEFNKTVFLPNAIDSFWKKESSNIIRSGAIFVSANLDEKRKGIDQLMLLASNSNFSESIHAVGKGGSEKILKELGCTMYGLLCRDELRKVMRQTKFVLSLSDTDNSPNAVLEAILQGNIPIVKAGSGVTAYIPCDLIARLTFNHIFEIPELVNNLEDDKSVIAQACRDHLLELTNEEHLTKTLKKFLEEKIFDYYRKT